MLEDDTRRTGPKCKLTKAKIAILHKSVMRHPQLKYVANDLGLNSINTVKNYLAYGEQFLEQYEDKLIDLFSIYSGEYEDIFEDIKIQYEDEFCMKYDLEDGKIPDKLRPMFNSFMQKARCEFIERKVSQEEDKVLESAVLHPNSITDDEIKLYIKFYRVYTRARAFKEGTYIENLDTFANTSKNVAISLKMLEKLNKEDFGEQPREVNVSGNVGVQHFSIIDLAIEEESRMALPDNLQKPLENGVIDVPEEDIIREVESLPLKVERGE